MDVLTAESVFKTSFFYIANRECAGIKVVFI